MENMKERVTNRGKYKKVWYVLLHIPCIYYTNKNVDILLAGKINFNEKKITRVKKFTF